MNFVEINIVVIGKELIYRHFPYSIFHGPADK